MKKLAAPLFSLLLLALFAGCQSSTAGVAGLNAGLVRIERGAGGELSATIRFINPNVYSYAIDRSEHRVYSGNTQIGTVKIGQRFAVPMQQTIEMTGVFVPQGGGLPAGGSLNYRLESTIVIRTYGDDTQNWKNSASGTAEVVNK